MFDALHQLIAQFVTFTDREKAILENAFVFKQVPRKFALVRQGQVANELYFINKGMLRLFYENEGDEITAFIFRENLFASSYDSFLRQTPSIQSLEALEEADLLVITQSKMNELYEELPKFNILTRKIAEQRFINAQQILSSFLLDSPEERYAKFVEQNGDLLLRVTHHIIASYLGMTPVSMSRIRNRLAQQKR
ncbi:Crp/Fnr family transcriptional regulator [Runella sp. SP2]|uniref:Crp/Fnr family transcriptional regulator n=1 Tax=Runella sp. SP2 TaxID=2268026 RepID=UPI000F0900AF|nr:Crp/Fnr family transcriptional regulator [Runella sp. SP2]AYQ30715.1 Crp/Fnr family transcriptional regulator [Runella sp. SP2]